MKQTITAWLVKDKDKMKSHRCIWFNREHATMFKNNFEEVKRIKVSWKLGKNKGK